jgi:ubiquinone/menaquinone biosynthesis C-methylase UbiE
MSVRTDPAKFNIIARTAFAPIYPYIAEQIMNKFGITEGVCVDAGSGPGSLAIALARITDLKIFSLDIQPEMTALATANIAEAGLQSRVAAVTADVCAMPFADNSVDLLISRGSLFFWDDRAAAFSEIKRILKPGGVAFVGGGMGSEQIRAQVMQTLATNEALKDVEDPFKTMMGHGQPRIDPAELEKELVLAGANGKVIRDNGMWVEIHKEE